MNEEELEQFADLKKTIADDLQRVGVTALPYELERDVYVEGPLSVIQEWLYGWRSEVEELGDRP